ncbi:hypothetical protein J4225_01635 [Candidatus Pacearchaeota archaeon]|nr:hypothetical protein [Candidatus Pacearchaeota archaeon]
MLGGIISLASYSYSGGTIGNILNQWAEIGAFSYALPFLLIFALIYGILSSMKLFGKNRAVDAVIAFSVGLMALQFGFVPEFFSNVFPRLGVGLAVLLVILILAGFFVNPKKAGLMYTLMAIGLIIAIIVLIQTSAGVGWYSGWWWYDNWPMVAFIVFILIALAIIIGTSNPKEAKDFELGPWRIEQKD